MKNQLFILTLLCLFLNTISAQTDSTSIFEIKFYDDVTNIPLPDVYVEFTQKDVKKLWFHTRKDGTYKVELKEGNYSVRVDYPGFNYIENIELEIKGGESIEKIVKLTNFQKPIPQDLGVPIPKLYGFWKVVYVDDGKNRLEQTEQIRESGICFSAPSNRENFFYINGCTYTQGLWFRHHGNGEIEIQKSLIYSTGVCVENGRIIQSDGLKKIVQQLLGRFHVSFIQDDEIIIKTDSIEAKMKRIASRHYKETGVLIGKIYDKDDDTAIKKADIKILKNGKHVGLNHSKEDGIFELRLEEGKYQVYINHPCYQSQNIEIDINNRQTIEEIIKLEKRENLTFDECNNSIYELYGFWKVDCIKYNNKKIRQRKQIGSSGITFADTSTASKAFAEGLIYNDGCHDYHNFLIVGVKGRKIMLSKRQKDETPYYCENKNIPLIEAMKLLEEHCTYTLKDDDTLTIIGDNSKQPLEIHLSRVD